jgi:hypothetical protein
MHPAESLSSGRVRCVSAKANAEEKHNRIISLDGHEKRSEIIPIVSLGGEMGANAFEHQPIGAARD